MTQRGIYTPYDQIDTTPQVELGAEKEFVHPTHKQWRMKYVKAGSGSAAISAGDVLLYGETSGALGALGQLVTNDASDAHATAANAANFLAGVAVVAVTAAQIAAGAYFWILIEGRYPTIATNADDDIAAGDVLIASGADGTCNSTAAGTAPVSRVLGWALEADVNADDTVNGYVKIC